MIERIVFTRPDGSVGVITPTGELTVEQTEEADVPRLVTQDITFPDDSVLAAGELIKLSNFYGLALEHNLSDEEIENGFNQLEVIPSRIITTAELPKDRAFRNAWDDSNPEDFIGLNLDKAKEIAHNIRREDRQTKLEPLDKEAVYVGISAERKAENAIQANKILDDNALWQIDIDDAVDETDLRSVLKTII